MRRGVDGTHERLMEAINTINDLVTPETGPESAVQRSCQESGLPIITLGA